MIEALLSAGKCSLINIFLNLSPLQMILSGSGATGITFELQKEREQLALESAKATLKQARGRGEDQGVAGRGGQE